MNQYELVNRVKILAPDSKFSVWEGEGDYFGETSPIIRFGLRVDWGASTTCPTEEEILSVTADQLTKQKETEEDAALINRYSKNGFMKTMYKHAKAEDPSLTFAKFLKNAENEDVE